MSFPKPQIELSQLKSNGAQVVPVEQESQGNKDNRDELDLIRLGKRPVLKRNFGFMSILGYSCTILITWEGVLFVLNLTFSLTGPVGTLYGFIIVWAGSASVYSVLSELVSMAPTAGGQYHFVSMLAPRSMQKFLSYITGWLTVCGWQASLASSSYLAASLIQGLVTLTKPEYTPERWHITFILWAVLAFALSINSFVGWLLPQFEVVILVIHFLGFLGVMLPLIVLGPHGSATDVFSRFINGAGWPTHGLSFIVGIIGNVWTFVGVDGAIHMSEEIQNASVVVPRSIMLSTLINGMLGLGIIITLLFCMGNAEDALNTPTGFPFFEIFLQATNSLAGTTVMISICIVMALSAPAGLLAAASRMCWSFSRDRGLPGWRIISRINRRTSIPVYSLMLSVTISILLSLINFGSSTAFNATVSLTVSSLYFSYLIAASLLLWRRTSGGIFSAQSTDGRDDLIVNTPGTKMVWGPWYIPGILGIVNNTFACLYMVTIFIFSFWPPEYPVTAQNMNYSIVVSVAICIFSLTYYAVWARKEYVGPVVEISRPRIL